MDELSALPPEGSWKRSTAARVRTNPRYSYSNPGFSPATVTSTTRAESPGHSGNINDQTTLSVNGEYMSQSNSPVILAPTPRRHLLESSASQHWLNTPPISPLTSSRPLSSLSQTQNHTRDQSILYPLLQHSTSAASLASAYTSATRHSPNYVRRRFDSNATHRRSFSSALSEQDQFGARQHQYRNVSGRDGIAAGVKGQPHEADEPAMGRRWIRWMHHWDSRHWVVPGVITASTLVKFAVGLGTYSGHNTPPMYGDYEAQRHWMELTLHLPFSKWYTYDLPYWGLDYPPLTAYVSWFCGFIAHLINPSWVALGASRGIESGESKAFMRTTVVAMDALVYVPALLMFARTWQGSRTKRTQEVAFLTLILQPALLLIDFGHFQYNSVMLGFTLLAMNFFAMGEDLTGAFFFVLSLGFKQMALYYAPAIGSYLVAKCLYLGPVDGLRLFIRLGLVTVSTFILLFLPWLPPFASFFGILQPFIRIFPFARGLFEDKVANFWCASNVVFKWKAWASPGALVKLSTLLTVLGFMPAVVGMIRCGVNMSLGSWFTPEKRNDDEPALTPTPTIEKGKGTENERHTPFLPLLPYALLTSSMSFFLFSFQVHEKTILLPLLPITLLLSGAPTESAVFEWGVLANNVAVFSMWPLLKRDGLGIQYLATMVLWNRLIGYNPIRMPRTLVQFIATGVYAAAFLLHVAELVFLPPARYPDIFPVLNVLISTPVFVLVWLWSIKCGVEVSWALGGLGSKLGHQHAVRSTTEEPDTAKGTPRRVKRRKTSFDKQAGEGLRRRGSKGALQELQGGEQ